ncbi:membrane-bound serine racemase VanT [Candidatus Enterococcus clewellii]|uniref:Alanine racemase n=1 Tax=Candidatus Enterococcus clewellii TaxID=1834193 RepID=A0A242K721_9ENTE|nr:membrane-bound serine racemase VanT [Enterococcus sp. 9E7_DIV0242]OTP16004.1 alanine racemase [Enterococcus sp. 9E7_DIV0242]
MEITTSDNQLRTKSIQTNRSSGIDQFRLIAAVMVIAIHTFPFASINEGLDQVVTLTLFRVAVPFFFMVTGYYVLGPYAERRNYPKRWRIDQTMLELLKLYLIASLLYLPLSLYTGVLALSKPLSEWIKVLVFDGPLYHLWYFPAMLLGLILSRQLLQRLSLSSALFVAGLLYMVGLGGDSYYSIVTQIPAIKTFYSLLFQLFDYTRNGLFFVPLFLCLGALLYLKRARTVSFPSIKLSVSLLALGLEGFFLHTCTKMRHDSMYLMLPVVSYYLLVCLLHWQPRVIFPKAKDYSLWLYILHPWSILLVYYCSTVVGFLQNSLLQFFLILAVTSGLTAVALSLLKKRKREEIKEIQRARKRIDLSALEKNYRSVRTLLPKKTKLMAVVKADAYGHGAVKISRFLEQQGVDFFAVATLEEAIQLRKKGLQGEILVLGYTSPQTAIELNRYELIQAVFSLDYAAALNRKRVKLRCHVKIDTGMHRLGFAPCLSEVQPVYTMKYLRCEGIYSHLGSADAADDESRVRTEQQIETFARLLVDLKKQGIEYGVTHLQSSYGVVNYPELSYDYARVGIFLYGVLSQRDQHLKSRLALRPVLSIHAVLVSVRQVSVGQYIGYGTALKAEQEMRIGTVAIGYADGLPRNLSNTGYSLHYKDFELPQIGNICMDMLLVDITDIQNLALGTELTIMESSEDIAEKSETISNEVLSRIGIRLENGT